MVVEGQIVLRLPPVRYIPPPAEIVIEPVTLEQAHLRGRPSSISQGPPSG